MIDGLPHIYVDTNIIQPLLYNSDSRTDREFCERIFSNMRGDVRADEKRVFIPKPVVGEVVDNFRSDHDEYGPAEVGNWQDFAQDLHHRLGQIDAELCPIDDDAFDLATKLRANDTRFDGIDALVAGCALADNWSTHLVTADSDFHESEYIRTLNDERRPGARYYDLRVTDSYGPRP
jgi:hypothetical protein